MEASAELIERVGEHEISSREALIRAGGIRPAVAGAEDACVLLVAGSQHFRLATGELAVGMQPADAIGLAREERARYVLEVLAHGFHDYAARECVRRFVMYLPLDDYRRAANR
jgi:hypothetical protein